MDLFVANIDEEIFSLYQNNTTARLTIKPCDWESGNGHRWMSGWGMKFIDYDNDGDLDLFFWPMFPRRPLEDFSSQVKYTNLSAFSE